MAGFRKIREIQRLLELFSGTAGNPLLTALNALGKTLDGPGGLRQFLTGLFGIAPEVRGELSRYARSRAGKLREDHPEYAGEWGLYADLAERYPGDPGVIAPLYLNLIDRKPREALYLPSGVLHAYVHGLGIELMANSDNVLRGGLTAKHVDPEELVRVLDFTPLKPEILKPVESAGFRYETGCREFSLSVMQGQEGEYAAFPEPGPAIILVTGGRLTLLYNRGRDTLVLSRGESAFIPARESPGEPLFRGDYTLYAASPSSP
jgi:mannose-6-phosphate isomerase